MSLTPGESVRVLDLDQFGGGATYADFEAIDLGGLRGAPIALTGDAAIDVLGGAGPDVVHALGDVSDDILLGAGDDRFIVYDGFSFGAVDNLDGGEGIDTLTIFTNAGRTISALQSSAERFEILEKRGAGALTLDASRGAGLRAIDMYEGVLTFSGDFGSGGGDADVFGGVLNLQGDFEFGPMSGVFDRAPIEVHPGGTLAADGELTFLPGDASFNPPAGLYVEGGALSPGGAGSVGAMELVAQGGFGTAGPFETEVVLALLRGGGGPAELLVDWGSGRNVDSIDVAHDGLFVFGATSIDQLLVTFNPLSGGAIGAGDSADLITSEAFRFGPSGSTSSADAAITFAGVPPGLSVTYSFESAGSDVAFRVNFVDAASSGSAVATAGALASGALFTSASSGGAMEAAGGLGDGATTFGLVSSASGWTALGEGGARGGVTRRAFVADIAGAPAHALSEATRSVVAGPILGGRLVAGLGSGLEQATYIAEGETARDQLTGRTQTGYVSAFLASSAAGWRLAAASDIAAVSLRFDSPGFGGLVDTAGRRLRMELQASRPFEIAGAPLELDLGVRHVDLVTAPYRRQDGLWTAGPSARATTASAGLAVRDAIGGLTPYAQVAEPVSGEGEGWRLVGVRMSRPRSGFAFDAMLGEVDAPFADAATRVEARLSWRF